MSPLADCRLTVEPVITPALCEMVPDPLDCIVTVVLFPPTFAPSATDPLFKACMLMLPLAPVVIAAAFDTDPVLDVMLTVPEAPAPVTALAKATLPPLDVRLTVFAEIVPTELVRLPAAIKDIVSMVPDAAARLPVTLRLPLLLSRVKV